MRKQYLALLCLFSLSTSSVYAEEPKENNCGNLQIVITNASSETCKLVSQNLRHGFFKYTSSVPMYLPANSSGAPIFLTQTVFGPELELTYTCGEGKSITLMSKQNVCFLMGGTVYGQTIDNHNMSAEYQAVDSSFFWSQHGTLHWYLS